ncbi:MAG: hypothetical protein ACXACY_15360 [Candidatus Hodarchaeales archaeon]|jgi:hypothetical protein
MKEKQILVDSKKFNLFMERMENKMTLNEYEEKSLLVEGYFDDIIKNVRNAANAVITTIKPNIEKSLLKSVGNSFDKLIASAKIIDDGISANLNNLKSIRKYIGGDALSNFKQSFNILVNDVVKTFGFDDLTTKNISNYVRNNGTLPSEIIEKLTDAEISLISDLRNAHLGVITEINDLDNVIKYVDIMGDNPTVVDLFSTMYVLGDIKSLDDFKIDFDRLTKIANTDPDSNVARIWESIKNKISGKPKNGDEVVILFKKTLNNEPNYIKLKNNWEIKLKKYLRNKITGKVDEINVKLAAKNVDENSILFVTKKGEIFIVPSSFETAVRNGDNKYVTQLGANGGMSQEQFQELIDVTKKSRGSGRVTKIVVLSILGIAVLGATGYWGWCQMKDLSFDDKFIEDVKRQEGDAYVERKEPEGWDRIRKCMAGTVIALSETAINEAKEIFNENFKIYLTSLQGGVEGHLNEKCGRDDETKKGGKYVYPCKNCLDCENDVKIEDIKIGGESLEESYSSTLKDMDLKSLLLGMGSKIGITEENVEDTIDVIMGDANNGIINDMMTDDGKSMSMQQMVEVICKGHNLYCISQLIEKTLKEFYDVDSFGDDCDALENHLNEKYSLLLDYKEKEYLGWGEKGKVDLSKMKKDNPKQFVYASDVNGFFNVLEATKNELPTFCKEGVITKLKKEVIKIKLSTNLSKLMTEMWDEGVSKLNCTKYQYDLREVAKPSMQMSLSGILESIVEDENYKTYFHNLNPRSKEWIDSFDKWWDKQRKLCKYIIVD